MDHKSALGGEGRVIEGEFEEDKETRAKPLRRLYCFDISRCLNRRDLEPMCEYCSQGKMNILRARVVKRVLRTVEPSMFSTLTEKE